ncbi:MAG: Flp pilus assembly complex ATPase component TadA, partial [Gammaproteobacteria bacterium]|nr:Flp pilus assembly complex ATPase component TadA [Gammaproteobacteria bacterium]
MENTQLTLPVFSQLLEPEGMAPAQNFSDSWELVCNKLPSIESRAKVRFVIGEQVLFRLGNTDEVARLTKHWRAELSPEIADADDAFVSGFGDDDTFSDMDSEAPIIRLVNHLFARALDLNASDIHFEPTEHHLEVRCRVDGIMTRIEKLPVKIQSAVASRLKLMAKLDIGEKRLPQDGKFRVKLGTNYYDCRLSVVPSIFGENAVIRILYKEMLKVTLDNTGLSNYSFRLVTELLKKPHGLMLVTGPTGSGKTTTLYACMASIFDPSKVVTTVEDPVEYEVED